MTRAERIQRLVEATEEFDIVGVERWFAEQRALNDRLDEACKQFDYAGYKQALAEGSHDKLNAGEASPTGCVFAADNPYAQPMLQQYVLLRGRNQAHPKVEPFQILFIENNDGVPRLRIDSFLEQKKRHSWPHAMCWSPRSLRQASICRS